MNRLLLLLGVLATSALLVPGDAEAQRGGRGGGARIGAGGYGGNVGGARMVRPPVRGVSAGRVAGVRPGSGRYDVGRAGNYGGRYGARPGYGRYGVGAAGYYGGRYPYSGGYYGAPGWGAAGLVTGSVIGAAAASTYPVYQTPISSTVGGYCATTVRTCALTNAAPVGTGCSCRTQGGRARGTVVGG
jgi:hypothetical protein